MGLGADARGSLPQAYTTQGHLALLHPQEPRTTRFLDRIGVCVNTQKGPEGPKGEVSGLQTPDLKLPAQAWGHNGSASDAGVRRLHASS